MSKFNEYAKRAEKISKAAFAKYREAEKAVKNAEAAADAVRPDPKVTIDTTYEYRKTIARANVEKAKADFDEARRGLTANVDQIRATRDGLAAALDAEFAMDPAKLDMATLELLKSGILIAGDYTRLMQTAQEAENSTMIRLIGKYADKAAETPDLDRDDAKLLSLVSSEARNYTGDVFLQAFDSLADLYRRCVDNPALFDHWDEIVGELVENF